MQPLAKKPCWTRFVLAAALMGGLHLATVVVAADKPANSDPGKVDAKSGPDLSPIATAAHLALEGENRKSPLLLLAAAEILADIKQSRRDATGVKGDATGDTTNGRLPELDMQTLIDRARELANGNVALEPAVEAMIAGIESDSRGLVYRQGKELESFELEGVTYKVINAGLDRLDPGSTLTLENVVFEGGLPAQILVVGDGDGDLDLWVTDGNNGADIGSDTDETSVCVVNWTTRYEGPFTIVVKNVGNIYERFYVLANW